MLYKYIHMRTQFIILYTAILLFLTIIFLNSITNNSKFYYPVNNYKYIAENFYFDVLNYGCNNVNISFYNYCQNLSITCYCNTTDVVVYGKNFEYIFNI